MSVNNVILSRIVLLRHHLPAQYLCIAKNYADKDKEVVYQEMFPPFDIWTKTLKNFMEETVGTDGSIKYKSGQAEAGSIPAQHIGQGDASYQKAREILGNSKIIGMTAHNLEEALAAQKAGADYIGTGAVFPTSTNSYPIYSRTFKFQYIVMVNPTNGNNRNCYIICYFF